MKAAVFYGKHDLRIEDIAMPELKDDEVLVKVMACGICGTDIHIFEGDEGAAAMPRGTVLGHEFSGIVEKTGRNVKNIKIGDRVCVDPNKLCGNCYYCKSAIGHFCENIVGIGTLTVVLSNTAQFLKAKYIKSLPQHRLKKRQWQSLLRAVCTALTFAISKPTIRFL